MQDTLEPSAEPASNVSLREYGDILRRRRAIILQTFVIVLIAGVLITLFSAPTYRAVARLLVEPPQTGINQIDTNNPLSGIFNLSKAYSLETQVGLLQTSELQQKVADAINVQELPDMQIEGLEGTSIIEVTAEGDNQVAVANAANKLLELYVEQTKKESGAQLDSALAFARKQRDEYQLRLARVESQIQDFKQKRNIPELQQSRNSAIQNVTNLSSAYTQLLSDQSGLNTRIIRTRAALAKRPATLPAVVSPTADPGVQAIENQIFNAEVNRVALIKEFRPGNIRVVQVDAQLARLRQRLAQQRKSFFARTETRDPRYEALQDRLVDLDIEAAAVAGRVAEAGRNVQTAQARLAQFPSLETRYGQLARELETDADQLKSFSKNVKDMELRQQATILNARIVERAKVPPFPIRPKRAQNIIFAGLLGLFMGLGLALLQELFDDRINSPEEAERIVRLPSLGYIPMIEEEGLRLIRDISTFSPLMESFRTLRTNINFAAVGHPIKSLLVTSSVPAEGKSTTCANLAMAMALDGKRVIIVDADLRRPTQHALFKTPSSPGLTDILVGTHTIEEVIQNTQVEGVKLIPAGSPPPNPAELLGSEAMAAFLATVEASADIVLFDSPPSLAVADGVVLSSRTDGVLLVIGFGDTKKTQTRQTREMLTRANAHILGTVLNRMDSPSSGYYYGKYYVPTTEMLPSANGVNGNGSKKNGAVSAADRPALNEPVATTRDDK